MRTWRLDSAIRLDASIDEVFAYFSDATNLEELTPPWLEFEVTSPRPIEMREGATVDYRLRIHGFPVRWRSRIIVWDPPRRFVDDQEKGPYRLWHHEHRFESDGATTIARDRVTYAVPGGALVHALLVRRDVARIFGYRHRRLARRFGVTAEPEIEIRPLEPSAA